MIRRLSPLVPLALAALALAGCATTGKDGDYSSLPTPPAHPAATTPPPAPPPAAAPAPTERVVPKLAPDQYTDLLDRIRAGYALEDVQHFAVDREVENYRERPEFLDRTFRRGARYLHYIVTELEKRNMPLELALLPVVESAFNPVAYSRSRASGLWQFIPSSGKHYGLEQNWWLDERRDVIESTNAALNYLQYLHDYFNGDWYLAIAAYNGGEGTVSAAIQRNVAAGRPTDFFSLDLRPETRDYVPKLLAIRRIVANPEQYGLQFAPIPNQPYFTVVDPGHPVHLEQAATMAGITLDDMFALNPAFNRMTTPPKGPYRLLLPIDHADAFRQALLNPEQTATIAASAVEPVEPVRHEVRQGETLSSISRRYSVPLAAIRDANNLGRSSVIHVGDVLVIPRGGDAATTLASIAAPREDIAAQLPERQRARDRAGVHTVRSGDTLWAVARRYGVSVPDLAAANGLSAGSALSVGTRLSIPGGRGGGGASPSLRASRDDATRMTYRVRRGDTLSAIADRYNVSVRDLMTWNRLRQSTSLRAGQRLVLYVDPDQLNGG